MLDGRDKSAREEEEEEKRNSHDLYIVYGMLLFVWPFGVLLSILISGFGQNNLK